MTALGPAIEASSDSLLASLRQVSARIGSNPLLVQANTGNTSVKDDRTMWIKASGTALADAERAEIFVTVELNSARAGHRPKGASIETAMHALLPWRAILHVHSVNVVAWAVRAETRTDLTVRLTGLNWAWIPYVESGLSLGRAVQAAWTKAPLTNIFILANHGLVVCGDTCEGAEKSLREVEQRLALPARKALQPRLDVIAPLASSPACRLPDSDVVHTLAMDRACCVALRGGTLYPCQAIFFGESIPIVPSTIPLSDAIARHAGKPFIVFEGAGVVVSRGITAHQAQMLTGLAEIARRLEPGYPLRYLAANEIERLGSESYLK